MIIDPDLMGPHIWYSRDVEDSYRPYAPPATTIDLSTLKVGDLVCVDGTASTIDEHLQGTFVVRAIYHYHLAVSYRDKRKKDRLIIPKEYVVRILADADHETSITRHELLLLDSPEHPPTFVIRIDGDERLDEGYATPGALMDRLAVLGAIGARVSIEPRVEAALVRYLSRAYSGAFAALASDPMEGEAHDGR